MNKINSCERIDLSRLHESYFFGLAAVICFGAAALFINLNPTPMEILYLGVGLFLTSHAINRNMQFKFAQRSYKNGMLDQTALSSVHAGSSTCGAS